ncbi:MAG: hypothetical protein C4536_09390 [Actinobacteria bacterium]|nr:MAG: hypothetical protein C4536_09390 [Actinomycetota bacterium]
MTIPFQLIANVAASAHKKQQKKRTGCIPRLLKKQLKKRTGCIPRPQKKQQKKRTGCIPR